MSVVVNVLLSLTSVMSPPLTGVTYSCVRWYSYVLWEFLQYTFMLICSMMDAVVAVTVMHVLLLVLHVYDERVSGCEGDGNTDVGGV